MRTIVIILGFVLAFSLLGNGWGWIANRSLKKELGVTGWQLRKSNKVIQMQRDEIAELETLTDALKVGMVLKVETLRDSLKWQQSQTSQWKQNYAKAKNTRIPVDIPDAELERIISGLVGSDR